MRDTGARTDPVKIGQARLTTLKGIGPKIEGLLQKLGVFCVEDLLFHLPLRYEDRTQSVDIANLTPGAARLFAGRVAGQRIQFGRRRSLVVKVEDDSGAIELRFFHFSRYQQESFAVGRYLTGFGEPRFTGKKLEIAHPEYQLYDQPPPEPEAGFVPIYPTTKGLQQGLLRRAISAVCALPWPTDGATPYQTLIALHQPDNEAGLEGIAQNTERLARDELTAFYLVMKHRARDRQTRTARALPRGPQLGRELLKRLGFRLTGAQRRAATEVLTDLEKDTPMLRLLQGDVGSGKTVIAAFAAIRAAEQGQQTAIMAPTEILAEQHYLNFSQWLSPLGIDVVLLCGSQTAKERAPRLAALESGQALVAIGTHALFQHAVAFKALALTIVDEQHRFGVHQRMALRGKAPAPHQLVMTATPIPRTLTMALYADMEVSVIDELPKGRQPITTRARARDYAEEVVAWVQQVIDSGEQAYWVCPLIEPSDEIDAAAALDTYESLGRNLNGSVGLLHGRLKAEEKAAAMQDFKAGSTQVLVATTVVEVGVDVPNASMMVIENPERLGLAQLHQLRGRVGRGSAKSHCVLLHNSELSQNAEARIQVMCDSQDGFYLAEQDLKLRGPGEILGTRQSGDQEFRIADLTLHQHLVADAVQRGDRLMAENSEEAAALLRAWAPRDTGNIAV